VNLCWDPEPALTDITPLRLSSPRWISRPKMLGEPILLKARVGVPEAITETYGMGRGIVSDASVNSRKVPVTKKATCSPISTT
jgi:hypothetical protein